MIPGVGHQKGDLSDVINNAILNNKPNILINSSRGKIYASKDPQKFGQFSRSKVEEINEEISKLYSF